ncbi:MAG: futalosine hydrolase [Pseudonocardiales bacterium]|nr:futalosine hydrolase [Pseudonocardiales bacterium]
MKLLVITAVTAERDAILAAHPGTRVVVGGVGPAASAAATATALAAESADLVLSAGIGGGFAPLGIGDVAVASTIVFADLGAQTPEGFTSVSALGFGSERYEVSPRLAVELADATAGHLGAILTVATVTGTAAGAAELLHRTPDAVAEAMEGAGVAAAARLHGVPVAEIRAVSNQVGPRDRGAWDVPAALAALGRAVAAVATGQWQP